MKVRIKMIVRNSMFGAVLTAMVVMGASAAHADTILVPKGVNVPLVFDQTLSSKHAKAGDTVQLHVARDVVVNGHTIIRHGTHVSGGVSGVRHRKNFGVNAKMRLVFDPVKSEYGKHIDLQPRSAGKYTGS